MERVILDRSIFHNYESLKRSRLAYLARHLKLQVLLTPMFIEETLTNALHHPAEFRIHWNYIKNLAGTKWLNRAELIVDGELGQSAGPLNHRFMTVERVNYGKGRTDSFISGELPTEDFLGVIEEIKENKDSLERSRDIVLDIRKKTPPGNYSFHDYFELEVEWFIENGLMQWHKNSSGFLDAWRKRRKECIFTEQFIKAWFTVIFLPLIDRQAKVGVNDFNDAEQLAYMIWADILVSDDEHYMKEGFNLLYDGTGKRFMASEQYISYMEGESRAVHRKLD